MMFSLPTFPLTVTSKSDPIKGKYLIKIELIKINIFSYIHCTLSTNKFAWLGIAITILEVGLLSSVSLNVLII